MSYVCTGECVFKHYLKRPDHHDLEALIHVQI